MSNTVTLEEIGAQFGRLLGQAFAADISQKNRIAALEADNAALSVEIERLRAELHQAQSDLIAAQGKAVIDRAQQKSHRLGWLDVRSQKLLHYPLIWLSLLWLRLKLGIRRKRHI